MATNKTASSGKRQRLAFVTVWLPDPEGTGSEQRSFSFLKAYARHFDVDLWFSSRPYSWEFSRISKLTAYCKTAQFFHVELLRNNVDLLQDHFNASIASADHVHLFKLPFGIQHKSLLWDYDELPQPLREKGRYRISEFDKKFEAFAKTPRLKFCSSTLELDADIGPAHVVPNCYHLTEARKKQQPTGDNLLFTGTWGYMPNLLGLQFFISKILPLLPQHVTLTVVGRKPRDPAMLKAMRAIEATPRVTVHYNVPTCSPFYDSAAAAIVPLLHGTGTRLKIMEAFAHRCPVVSTSKGCEGLDVTDGQELLVRDDPQAFADACMLAISDKPMRQKLARFGLRLLRDKNSQQKVEEEIDSALTQAGILPRKG